MSEQHPQPPLQLAPFAMEECRAIFSVIKGYIRFLQRTPLFPAKETREERDRRIQLLSCIADRLGRQLAVNPTVIQLPLNAEEVEEVIKALIGFVTYIQQVVPQSVQRDETLSAVNEWRLRLVSSLSSIDALN